MLPWNFTNFESARAWISTECWYSPLVFPGVRVGLVFAVDYSTCLTGHWFWLRVFPFTWLGVMILTTACSVYLTWTHWFWLLNFAIEMGLTAGATGRQGILTPPRHLIPPPVFPGVRVSSFVYLTCNSYLSFETDYSSVSWPLHYLKMMVSKNL
jgi:hypothetical protein